MPFKVLGTTPPVRIMAAALVGWQEGLTLPPLAVDPIMFLRAVPASSLAQPPTVGQALALTPRCQDAVTVQPLARGDGSEYPQALDSLALLLTCGVTPDKTFASMNLCPYLESG